MLNNLQIIILYILTVPVFFAIDLAWIGKIAKSYYARQMGDLLTKNVVWPAAISFYLIYIFGIIYFAVLPGLEKGSLGATTLNGILFGGIAYATYDLTNLATTTGWPTQLVFVDIAWGIVLTTSVALISYFIATTWLT